MLLTVDQESESRNIDLDDDDVESVRKVLSFMYTGTYEDEQTRPNALQLARQILAYVVGLGKFLIGPVSGPRHFIHLIQSCGFAIA